MQEERQQDIRVNSPLDEAEDERPSTRAMSYVSWARWISRLTFLASFATTVNADVSSVAGGGAPAARCFGDSALGSAAR